MEILYIINLFREISEKFNYQYSKKLSNKKWSYDKNIIIKKDLDAYSMVFYFFKLLEIDVKVFSLENKYLEVLNIDYEKDNSFKIKYNNTILCEEDNYLIIYMDNLLKVLKELNIKLYDETLDISVNLKDTYENIKLANTLRLNGYKVDKFKKAKIAISDAKDDLLLVEGITKEEVQKDYILMYLNERGELNEEIYEY